MSIEDFTPDDEIVSAYLDDEATAEEIARVQASPEMLARVEAFREVDLAVAAPVTPPPPEVRENAIAAALAASQTAPNVTSLAAAREKKRAFSPRILAMTSAAAAVVIGFIAVVTLADFSTDGGDSASEVASVEESADEAASDDATDDAAIQDGDAAGAAVEPADEPAEEPAEEEMAEEEPPAAAPESEADEAVEVEAPAEEEAAVPVPQPTRGPGLFTVAFDLGVVNDIELEDLLSVEEDVLLADPTADRGLAFGNCRESVEALLSSSDSILYVATAILDGQAVEIYGIGRDPDDLPAPLVRFVDVQFCEIVLQLTR